MDKKFWVAVEGEGTYVADDAYPTTTMWLYSPVWEFDLPDLDKLLDSFDIVCAPLPSSTRIDLEYSVDEGDWVSAGSLSTAGATSARLRVSTASSTVRFRNLRWRCGLTSINGVDTPRVRSVTARARVIEYQDYFDLTILLEDDTSLERLRGEQLSGRAKAKRLWRHKQNRALLTFEDHYSSRRPGDKDTYTVVIEDPFQEITERGQSSLRLKLLVVD
jgi:hypothetical protein